MTIAICRKYKKKAAPQDMTHTPPAKMTYTEEAASLVPDYAAR
jgi:hypothetical protein